QQRRQRQRDPTAAELFEPVEHDPAQQDLFGYPGHHAGHDQDRQPVLRRAQPERLIAAEQRGAADDRREYHRALQEPAPDVARARVERQVVARLLSQADDDQLVREHHYYRGDQGEEQVVPPRQLIHGSAREIADRAGQRLRCDHDRNRE